MSKRTIQSRLCLPLAAAVLMLGVSLDAAAVEPPAPELQPESTPEIFGSVHVEVRMQGVAPELAEQLRTELDTTIEQHAAAVGLTAAQTRAADCVIEVEVNTPAGAPLTTVSSVASIDGQIVGRQELETCMRCGAPELLERVLVLLPKAAGELRERVEAERSASEARRDRDPRPAAVVAPAAGERPRLGPAGYAGIGVTVAAIGTAVAGGVLLGRGEQVVGPQSGPLLTVTDYRPGGWALLGAALGGVVIGQTLLGVDLGVLAPRRASRRRAELSGIGPMFGDGLGVGVAGKF